MHIKVLHNTAKERRKAHNTKISHTLFSADPKGNATISFERREREV